MAVFLLLAAVDHLSVATWARDWYDRQVARGINPARWWEYAVSASLMIVLIAMLAGVREVTALIALFGVNAAMILFGLGMERANSDASGSTGGRSSTAASRERSPDRDRGGSPLPRPRAPPSRASSSPSSSRCCSCSTRSRSTCGFSTAASGAGPTRYSRNASTWCSAWPPRAPSPGRYTRGPRGRELAGSRVSDSGTGEARTGLGQGGRPGGKRSFPWLR